MPRASLVPLSAALGALLLGAPAYLVLGRFAHAPPSFLDRPWPLVALVVLMSFIATLAGSDAGGGAPRKRRVAAAVAVCAASLLALLVVSRRALPESSPEVAVGSALPDVALTDELGHAVALSSLRGHPLVLVFYRGALCVACRAQLSLLADQARAYLAEGVRVLGVSADPPPVSAKWKSILALPFSLLSDERQGLAQSVCSARAHCLLLVNPGGIIRWGALNDYWRGAERPESVLLAAYRLDPGRAGERVER